MEFRPILSALLRHKTVPLLMILEVALSCAVLCNAIFIIAGHAQHMSRASGVDEDQLVNIAVTDLSTGRSPGAMRREDLAALASIAHVTSVTSINQVPFGSGVWASGVSLSRDPPQPDLHASNYMDDGSMLKTLGLQLVEGRTFGPDEYIEYSVLNAPDSGVSIPSVILSKALALRLFHGDEAVGKQIYAWGDSPIRVVGVIDRLLAPGNGNNFMRSDETMIFPVRVAEGNYLLRTDPSYREEVLKAAETALLQANPNRVIDARQTVSHMRDDFYSRDRSVIWLLVAVCAALLAVTALGIVGLASFWVQQRTRQIGVRRALGATRRQILNYFQLENFMLASAGVIAGTVMAFGINHVLTGRYEVPVLPWYYPAISAVGLWVLGQCSVFWPARRAASVAPAVATRNR